MLLAGLKVQIFKSKRLEIEKDTFKETNTDFIST